MLTVTYDPAMVAASLMIAIMASFTGLRLASGLSRLSLAVRKQEIAKAAIALGGGIWSMHFVGMLAVQLPVRIFYDALPTLGSVLVAILQYTPLGLQIRAVAQNRDMARSMGVRGGFVDAATFGLGSGVAGLAGVALSQLTNVGPNLGQAHIVDSFMVVVFGGVGNLWGTLVAGLSLGVANKFLEPFAGAVLAKILVLVCIILCIQRRPRGLFPQQGRAAEG